MHKQKKWSLLIIVVTQVGVAVENLLVLEGLM